ncbi:MAG: inositol monophosphatase [Anaerolineae bacterium]|nr:inositol monophosphatase [Anaerolineae bacterium]
MSNSLDLFAALEAVEIIARQAGAILRMYFERPRAANHKSTAVDLVTEADQQSEAYIVDALKKAFPGHGINGEEGGGYGPESGNSPFQWWIDPLDGTTNFAHRYPVFSVSISLSDPDLNPILGVVYDPVHGEMFKAIRGHGATLNGRRLHVSTVNDLGQALVITGFPYDRWTNPDNNVAEFGHFVRRTQGVRRVGSAALDLCYVAAGRCDVYWEHGPNPWDVLAGILCVLEAGGRVSDYHGSLNRDALCGSRTLATNGHVHDQAVAVLTRGEDAPLPAASEPATS